MTDDEAIVRRLIQEAFNEGRLDSIEALLAPDFVEHQSMGPGAPKGRDAPKAIVSSLRRGFSDFHLEVEDSALRGDTVWLRLRGTGTHDGPFMGRAPSGRRVSVMVFDVMRVERGKIVEHWGVPDALSLLRQIEAG